MSNKAVTNFEQKCKKFFDEANGGDPINVGQLARVIRKACPSFRGEDSEIAQMFMEVDENDDRMITWEEFSEALFAKDPKEVTRAELEEKFKEMDADGSKKLSRSEVAAVIKDMEINLSDEGLTQLMENADPNGDGVDFNEFLEAFNSSS